MRFSLRLNNDLALREYVALAQAAEAATSVVKKWRA